MPRTPSVTIRGERVHAIHGLTPRRASRPRMARAIVVFPAPSGPTIAYTLAAHEPRDLVVSAQSLDPLRSLGARFGFMGRLPSGFGRSFKTVPEIDSTIGETSPTRGNTSRACPVLLSAGAGPPRNVTVIRLRARGSLPTGGCEDCPAVLHTTRLVPWLPGRADH